MKAGKVKTAVLGGSFNPVHIGHLHLASLVFSETDYEKILFIPLNIPPHKEIEVDVSASHRIRMLELALESLSLEDREIVIDTCEIERGGYSYSYETVKTIYSSYEVDGKLGWIIGDDLVPGLQSWYNWNELKKLVLFLIARREIDVSDTYRRPDGCSCMELSNRIISVSSSMIRRRISEGLTVGNLLPEKVYEYIKEHRLYQHIELD